MTTALIVLEGVVLVLMAVLVAGLLRSHAEVLARLHRLEGEGAGDVPVAPPVRKPHGRPANSPTGPSEVVGVTPSDETVSVALHPARHPTLLAFLSSGCTACAPFWEGLRAGGPLGLPDSPRVVVVTLGPAEESPDRLRRLAAGEVPVVMSTEAWKRFGVPGAPYFVWVDGAGGNVRGEGTGRSWSELASLVTDAAADQAGRRGADDEARVDAELARAGILPGDPRLHPAPGTGTG